MRRRGPPAPTRSRRCRRSCATRCATARSASPAARARRTTAKAACRCPRAWPATTSWPRSWAPWPKAAAASSCSPRAGTRRWRSSNRSPPPPAGPVMVAALLHNATNPRAVFADLDAIAAANARGHRLLGQVSCCPLTMDFTLASPYPVEGLASWKPALGLGGEALKAKLAERSFRDAVRARAGERRPPFASSTTNGTRSTSSRPRGPSTLALEQRTIADIARERGGRPARHDARPGARRRPADRLHRSAAQQRRGRRSAGC